MEITMMIFYKKRKFIGLTKIKFIPEIFMFSVMHHFATVNLNTFVCAEARRIAYE